MFRRNLFVLLLLLFNCPGVFSQEVQDILKLSPPDSKLIVYGASYPFLVEFAPEKNLIIAIKFLADPETDVLKGIIGFELFAHGLGKCFINDTLKLAMANGKKITLKSSNPEICDKPISGWILLNKENLDTLFSAKLQQITYINGKTHESLSLDITEPEAKEYFLTLKKIYDLKVSKAP